MNIRPIIWIPCLLSLLVGSIVSQYITRVKNKIPSIPSDPDNIQVFIRGPKGPVEIEIDPSKYGAALKSLRAGFWGVASDQTALFPWYDTGKIALAPIGTMRMYGTDYDWYKYDNFYSEITHRD